VYEFFDVDEYFGKVWRSFFSLFQLCTLDKCMTSIVRPVSAVYGVTLVYFLFIICACTLGLLNVMTAIVCRDALITAKDNEMKQKQKEELERKKNIILLRQVLACVDVDRDGNLSSKELALLLKSGNATSVQGYSLFQILKNLDVLVDDVLNLYRLVDKESVGSVKTEDLVKAIVKFRGESRSQDVVKLVVQVQGLVFKCGHIDGKLDALFQRVDQLRTTYTNSVYRSIADANLPGVVVESRTEPSQSSTKQTNKPNVFRPTFALPGSIDFARIERANLPSSAARGGGNQDRAGNDRDSSSDSADA
jgi:hypothetical protein